jgi:hypothetical protein
MIAAPGTVEYSNPSGPKKNPRTAARAGSLEEPTTTTWEGAEKTTGELYVTGGGGGYTVGRTWVGAAAAGRAVAHTGQMAVPRVDGVVHVGQI